MAVGSVSCSPNLLLTSSNSESSKYNNNIEFCSKEEKETINQNILGSADSEFVTPDKCNRRSIDVDKNKLKEQVSTRHDKISSEAKVVEESVNSSASATPLKKDSGIRATAKQIYPNIACLPLEDNIIYCFSLSVWNNIVGPQTVYVWKKKTKLKKLKYLNINQNENNSTLSNENLSMLSVPANSANTVSVGKENDDYLEQQKNSFQSVSQEDSKDDRESSTSASNESHKISEKRKLCLSAIIQYVTDHAVFAGETNKWKGNKLVSDFLSVPQQDIIVFSVRFVIIEEGVRVPYSLSAVIPKQDEAKLLSVMEVFKETFHRIAVKIRLFISKNGLSGGDQIRPDLQELCSVLSSLKQAGLTQFSLGEHGQIPDDRPFAEKILTSHFQTMGTSLVIANSPNEANKVVMWLGQFLPKDDRAMSHISFSDIFWSFQPGVVVQAVVRSPNGSFDLSSSKLLDSIRPLTLIDLSSNSVRQLTPLNIHSKNSSATFRMQLMALFNDLDHAPAPSYSLFETVERSAPLVKRFLHEYDKLKSCDLSVKTTYQESFLRSLYYMALAVITWTKNEWIKEKKKNSGKSIFEALCSAFNIEEADLKIIVAFAESLQSGYLPSHFFKSAKE